MLFVGKELLLQLSEDLFLGGSDSEVVLCLRVLCVFSSGFWQQQRAPKSDLASVPHIGESHGMILEQK